MARARQADPVLARRGDLVVERDRRRPSGRLLLQSGMEASYVDLADPAHLEFDYLRWMRIVLRAARARRVLHIGGGACALPRALAAEIPDGRQEVCELDGDVIDLAREHMGLRRAAGLRVRHREGRSALSAQADSSWDAIVIDAFDGAVVPRSLVTTEAFAEAARVAPLTLVNVIDDRSARELQLVAAGLAAAYPRVWTLGARVGNTVVAGCRALPDLARIGAAVAADPSPARLTGPAATAQFLQTAAPLRDAPASPPAVRAAPPPIEGASIPGKSRQLAD
ncbi:MAG: fused MFS/spermidine synthase [Solirubrobacteraceae bacterium]